MAKKVGEVRGKGTGVIRLDPQGRYVPHEVDYALVHLKESPNQRLEIWKRLNPPSGPWWEPSFLVVIERGRTEGGAFRSLLQFDGSGETAEQAIRDAWSEWASVGAEAGLIDPKKAELYINELSKM